MFPWSKKSNSKQQQNCSDEDEDPCKRYGCRLQACYYELLSKQGGAAVLDDSKCDPFRKQLEQCRKEHGLWVDPDQKQK